MTTGFRYTTADLELLPEVEGVRYEIIDGELYVTTQPHGFHQYTSSQIATELSQWIRGTGTGAVLPAPGIIFSDDNNVAPDLVWFRSDSWAESMDAGGHFHYAPDLVVEVLSPGVVNKARDRELKPQLYSRRGVREYWIADYRARTVQVYRLQDGELQLVATLSGADVLTSPLLPGFACPVSRFWASGGQ
jgi:Uma2 family endonuclease